MNNNDKEKHKRWERIGQQLIQNMMKNLQTHYFYPSYKRKKEKHKKIFLYKLRPLLVAMETCLDGIFAGRLEIFSL